MFCAGQKGRADEEGFLFVGGVMKRQPLGRFGWGWWDYAICVEYVVASYHAEQDNDGNRYNENWFFYTKWQAVCLRDWGAYFV